MSQDETAPPEPASGSDVKGFEGMGAVRAGLRAARRARDRRMAERKRKRARGRRRETGCSPPRVEISRLSSPPRVPGSGFGFGRARAQPWPRPLRQRLPLQSLASMTALPAYSPEPSVDASLFARVAHVIDAKIASIQGELATISDNISGSCLSPSFFAWLIADHVYVRYADRQPRAWIQRVQSSQASDDLPLLQGVHRHLLADA